MLLSQSAYLKLSAQVIQLMGWVSLPALAHVQNPPDIGAVHPPASTQRWYWKTVISVRDILKSSIETSFIGNEFECAVLPRR